MSTAPRPFEPGDRIVDQEGEYATFVRYSDTGFWGFFAYRGPNDVHKLPIAGLRKVEDTPFPQRAWERAVGLRGYHGSPAAAADRAEHAPDKKPESF